ncbi:replication endonuclease [Neisseria dentiae]|uniref:replication endonuclease n=1 Tax=Neisseria dentiae TaxID=194197 RepID=UPI0035A00A99
MVMLLDIGQVEGGRFVRPGRALSEKCQAMPARLRRRAFEEWVACANADDQYGLLSRQEADEWLSGLAERFADLPPALRGIGLDASDEEICAAAEEAAREMAFYQRIGYGLEGLLKKAEERYGLDAAVLAKKEPQGRLGRLKDDLFWRRQMRRFIARRQENALREVGEVSRKRGLYVSNEGLARRKSQKARNASLLAHMEMVNELGQEFTLEALSAVSVSNPAIRRAELMVRIRGFEEIARLKGHVGEFFTLTCPSKFHKMHHFGKPNEKFNGATPREAVKYLNKIWARCRAEFHTKGINVYGFRVVEPHHDGTPHWHGLLFMEKAHRDEFRRIVAKYGCREDREELGLRYFATEKEARAEARRIKARLLAENGSAPTLDKIQAGLKTEARFWANKYFKFWKQTKAAARVDFESINWARGSAAGYIAKYIAKNIDGKTHSGDSIGVDFESEDLLSAATTAERVDAWASLHGTRQFQQIGGVPVTVWRELRRIVPTDDDSVLMRAQRAADRGDWAAFCRLLGGEVVKRADLPLALYKQAAEEGEVNRYGETPPPYTLGVYEKETGEIKVGRVHTWTRKQNGGNAAAWTRVNNCRKIENKPETAVFEAEKSAVMSEGDKKALQFREWLMWRKGIAAVQLAHYENPDELLAEFDREMADLAAAEAQIQPMSREAMRRIINKAAAEAQAAAKKSEDLRIYKEYLALLDRVALPVRHGIVPPEPKADFSAEKVARRLVRYTPPQYDRPESALARARALRDEVARFNGSFN